MRFYRCGEKLRLGRQDVTELSTYAELTSNEKWELMLFSKLTVYLQLRPHLDLHQKWMLWRQIVSNEGTEQRDQILWLPQILDRRERLLLLAGRWSGFVPQDEP